MADEEKKPFRILGVIRAAGNPKMEEEVRAGVKVRPGFEDVQRVLEETLIGAAHKVIYEGGESMSNEEIIEEVGKRSGNELG